MSRVEEEAQARAAQEAERLQKKADREARDASQTQQSREAFSKLVSARDQATQKKPDVKDNKTERTQQERAGETQRKTTTEAERKAMLARTGGQQNARVLEQARTFQGSLQRAQGETQQADQQRVEQRDTGVKSDRVDREERGDEIITRAEERKDIDKENARVEAQEQKRVNAAIDGNARGDAGGGGSGDRPRDGQAAAIGKAMNAAPAVEAKAAAHEVKTIPPELLEKLVSTVYLAVNQQGLKEFQIELKEGVLSGATLKISAEGGKISVRFSGLDAHKKNLVESSKGDLMRKLESKGLRLARLEVG